MHAIRSSWRYSPLVLLGLLGPCASHSTPALDAAAIEQAAGAQASVQDDGVVRIGWSRNDVSVHIDGVRLEPAAGLGSWAAFKRLPDDGVMMMGDTVVFEDEITPALDAAFAHKLDVTALHNHFTRERPPVYFMHVSGQAAEAGALAEGVRAMWDAIRQVRAKQPEPAEAMSGAANAGDGDFDVAALESILGASAQVTGDVVKFVFAREARAHGATVTATMGLSTWAAFSGDRANAAVAGDFAMTADEVQAVMHALRAGDIHIVALHNHMVDEQPRVFFLHYWATGPADELARGLRAALEVTARKTMSTE